MVPKTASHPVAAKTNSIERVVTATSLTPCSSRAGRDTERARDASRRGRLAAAEAEAEAEADCERERPREPDRVKCASFVSDMSTPGSTH